MNDSPEPQTSLQPKPLLLDELRRLIQGTRQRVARIVNRELVMLYWTIGRRIRQDVLGAERGKYGDEIVSTLSRQLSAEFGSGFSPQNIFHMLRFAEVWPDGEPVAALAERLSWSHLKEILYLKDDLQRLFYAELCRREAWSVRTLRNRRRSCGPGIEVPGAGAFEQRRCQIAQHGVHFGEGARFRPPTIEPFAMPPREFWLHPTRICRSVCG